MGLTIVPISMETRKKDDIRRAASETVSKWGAIHVLSRRLHSLPHNQILIERYQPARRLYLWHADYGPKIYFIQLPDIGRQATPAAPASDAPFSAVTAEY